MDLMMLFGGAAAFAIGTKNLQLQRSPHRFACVMCV